ncbi:MAG: hypothetical protein ACRDGR_10240 [bacterium]
MPGRSFPDPPRRLGASLLLLAASLLPTSPAAAYRVFFDFDEDSNRGTFQNEAVGPDVVPVKIVVELDENDGSPPWIHFSIEWSCEDDFLLGHGSIRNEGSPYPVSFPFTAIHWETCQLPSCWCESHREFLADFRTPVPAGTWDLTTLELSRQGYTGKIHDRVEFWIDCPTCDYDGTDDARRSMTIRSVDALAETAWGETKALYR